MKNRRPPNAACQRPFPEFGAKGRLAHLYPVPQYDLIIEPFVGAAAYVRRYWDRYVSLNDPNDPLGREDAE